MGIVTSRPDPKIFLNQYDDQLQKAIELLPQAKPLALQAEKVKSGVSRRNPAN